MRYTTGGVAHTAAVIEDDLQDRDTGLHKPHVKGLADLAAGAAQDVHRRLHGGGAGADLAEA